MPVTRVTNDCDKLPGFRTKKTRFLARCRKQATEFLHSSDELANSYSDGGERGDMWHGQTPSSSLDDILAAACHDGNLFLQLVDRSGAIGKIDLTGRILPEGGNVRAGLVEQLRAPAGL